MEKEITFYRKCLMTIGVNSSLESEDGTRSLFDYGIRKSIGKEMTLTAFLELHANRDEGAELVRIFDGFLLSYVVLILPEDRLIVGPYTNALPTESVIENLRKAYGGKDESKGEFQHCYTMLPELSEENVLISASGVLLDSYYNGKWTMRHDGVQLREVFPFVNESGNEMMRIQKVYRDENLMIDAVINGNLNYIEDFPKKIRKLDVVMRVPDPVRNLKNYMVIMNTILRKAAERGGASILDIDKLSSRFAKAIESSITIEKLLSIIGTMPYGYVMLVRENRFASYSTIVNRALNIMEKDLSATLEDVAEKLSVTPTWISKCLSRDTGMGFSRIMMKYRTDYAGIKLIDSMDSIESIAEESGFSDVSYFSRVFRKMKGMSPSEWRRIAHQK